MKMGKSGLMLTALALLLLFAARAFADQQFIVLHVEPPRDDIETGTLYQSGDGDAEFIFVPKGVTVLLLDRDGHRYAVRGRAAVAAERDALRPFEIDNDKQGEKVSLLDFLFGANPEERLGSTRVIPLDTEDGIEAKPAWRLHVGLLDKYRSPERFCLVGKDLLLSRSQRVGSDFAEITTKGEPRIKSWQPGEAELKFDDFVGDAAENKPFAASLKTSAGAADIEILPLGKAFFKGSPVSIAARLARRGCGIQALMMAD